MDLGHPDSKQMQDLTEKWHYDNTYKDFILKDLTYDIKKCDITCMFLFSVIS
jgi:hypothetical protein